MSSHSGDDAEWREILKRKWYYREADVFQEMTQRNMRALKEQFEAKDVSGNGLNATEFTYVMVKCLGAFVVNRVDFVIQCLEFFRQVDVNDDKSMEWEELTSYIVEAGMAKADGTVEQLRTRFEYEWFDNPVPNTEILSDIQTATSLSVWGGKDYVAAVEVGSPLLRLYEAEATKDFIHFIPVSQYRHDTAFAPHTLLTIVHVTEKNRLVTTSQDLEGGCHISFWDADSGTLLHRVQSKWRLDVGCWAESAGLVILCSSGCGPGTTSPIEGWCPKTHERLLSLLYPGGAVTGVGEVPGTVCRFLMTSHTDGNMCLWDMKRGRLLKDRVIRAHEAGVRLFRYNHKLQLAATVGYPVSNPRENGISLAMIYCVSVWVVSQFWYGEVYARQAAKEKRRRNKKFRAAARRAVTIAKLSRKLPFAPQGSHSSLLTAVQQMKPSTGTARSGTTVTANTVPVQPQSNSDAVRPQSQQRRRSVVSTLSQLAVNGNGNVNGNGRRASIGNVSTDSDTDSDDDDEVPTPRLVENFKNSPAPVYLLGHNCPILDVVIQSDGPLKHVVSADVKYYVRVWDASTHDCLMVFNACVTIKPNRMNRALEREWIAMKREQAAKEDYEKRYGKKTVDAAEVLKFPGIKSTYGRSRLSLSPTRTVNKATTIVAAHGLDKTGIDEIAADIVGIGKGAKKLRKQFPGSSQHKPDLLNGDVTIAKYITSVSKQLELEAAAMNRLQTEAPLSPQLKHMRQTMKMPPKFAMPDQRDAREKDKHWNADLRRLTCMSVMPRSATTCGTPLLVLFGNRIRTLRLVPQQPKAQPLAACLYSAAIVKFITVSPDSIIVWDGVSGRVERSYDARRVCSGADITAACLDDRGRKLVVGDSLGHIWVVNLKNGSVMKQLDPHGGQISELIYCMKERAVLSSAWDGQLHVCEEGSLEGYSPNDGSADTTNTNGQGSGNDEAFLTTLQRKFLLPSPEDAFLRPSDLSASHAQINEALLALNSGDDESEHASEHALIRPTTSNTLLSLTSKDKQRHRQNSTGGPLLTRMPSYSTAFTATSAGSKPQRSQHHSHNATSRPMTSGSYDSADDSGDDNGYGNVEDDDIDGGGGDDKPSTLTANHHHQASVNSVTTTAAMPHNPDDDVIEIVSFALSEHLNVVATMSRGYQGRVHLLLWSYDKARFLCACAMPSGENAVPEMVCMKFLEPFPALVTADDNGRMYLWSVPPAKSAGILRGVWDSPCKDGVMCMTVVPLYAIPPMIGVWHSDDMGVRRVYSSIGCRDGIVGDVSPPPQSKSQPQDHTGFALLCGDDVGVIHRWEVSGSSLVAAGFNPVSSQLRSDSFVERRLPKRRIRTSQVVLSELACAKQYRRFKHLPILTELTPLCSGLSIGMVWVGSWRAHSCAMTHISYIVENSTVMSSANDGLVRLWDHEGRLLGTLDPNPRNQPPQPPWQKPLYAGDDGKEGDVNGDDGGRDTGDDDHTLNDDTFTVTDRWHCDHIASVRVYDDVSVDYCGDVISSELLSEAGFKSGVNVNGVECDDSTRAIPMSFDATTTGNGVYVTQQTGEHSDESEFVSTMTRSPKTPNTRRVVVRESSNRVVSETSTPRTVTLEQLTSPRKRAQVNVTKQLNRMRGYDGVVMGAGVRVVTLSSRQSTVTSRNSNVSDDPLDTAGLKFIGLAPKRGRVIWHWEADLETRYVKNVAEAKEVLGMGRVMALAAKWRVTASERAAVKHGGKDSDSDDSEDDPDDPVEVLVKLRLKQLRKEAKRKAAAEQQQQQQLAADVSAELSVTDSKGGSKPAKKPSLAHKSGDRLSMWSVQSYHVGDTDDEGSVRAGHGKGEPDDTLFVVDDSTATVPVPVPDEGEQHHHTTSASVLSALKSMSHHHNSTDTAATGASGSGGAGGSKLASIFKRKSSVSTGHGDASNTVTKPQPTVQYTFTKPDIIEVPPDYAGKGKPSVLLTLQAQRVKAAAAEASVAAKHRAEEEARKQALLQAKLAKEHAKEEYFTQLARKKSVSSVLSDDPVLDNKDLMPFSLRATRRELAATTVAVKTDRQLLWGKVPGYFSEYGNLAGYKATIPSAALPQTSGLFAHTEPLRPNPAFALAQLHADKHRNHDNPIAPGDVVYGMVESQRRQHSLGHAALTSTLRAVQPLPPNKQEQERRARVREASLSVTTTTTQSPAVTQSQSKQREDVSTTTVLRGGNRAAANSYSVMMTTSASAPVIARQKQLKWTNLAARNVTALLGSQE